MEIRDYNNMDGELISTEAQLAISPVNNVPENGIYYYAGGNSSKRKSTLETIASVTPYGMAYNLLKPTEEGKKRRQQARQQRRDARTGAKLGYAQAQVESAKAMGKDSSLDKALADSLSSKKSSGGGKGLSTMAWVGIGVGALVLVVGGIFLVKKMGSKSGK